MTDRMLIKFEGSFQNRAELSCTKVFSLEEGTELMKLIDEINELVEGPDMMNVTAKYLTNKEYLVLVKFSMAETGFQDYFNKEHLIKALESLKQAPPIVELTKAEEVH